MSTGNVGLSSRDSSTRRLDPNENQAYYLKQGMEKLARWIARASVSQEKMPHDPEDSKTIYQTKGSRKNNLD